MANRYTRIFDVGGQGHLGFACASGQSLNLCCYVGITSWYVTAVHMTPLLPAQLLPQDQQLLTYLWAVPPVHDPE